MESNLVTNIKSFRKSKGYTQEELAGMLGVTPQAVSHRSSLKKALRPRKTVIWHSTD